MTDRERIDLMAELWIAMGGDADGLDWCWQKIKKAVRDLKEQ